MMNKQDHIFMYYIIVLLFMSIVILEFYITVIFNESNMERAKVRGGKQTQSKTSKTLRNAKGRKREDFVDDFRIDIEDKEEW